MRVFGPAGVWLKAACPENCANTNREVGREGEGEGEEEERVIE